MYRKFVLFAFVSTLFLSSMLASLFLSSFSVPSVNSVHNLNTGLRYPTIQEAIDAPETLDNHTIFAHAGTYYEHVNVTKSLTIMGENPSTTIIDGNERGVVVFIDVDYVTVSGFTIQNGGTDGIYLSYVGHNNIGGNNITNNGGYGIAIRYSHDNIIWGNHITLNTYWAGGGILLDYSDDNTVSGNNVNKNSHGIFLRHSSNCIVSGNNVNNNTNRGISVSYSSHNCKVSNNDLTNNYYGIYIEDSYNNMVSDNNVANNDYGIRPSKSNNNSIYHNNFVNSNINQTLSSASINTWDNGYPSGGNYWSNQYHGSCADHYSGPHQNETGSDGIVDTPYVIDGNNKDKYPLMSPWPWPIENLNTQICYSTIQWAIDAPETLDGHTINVSAGTYEEHVVVSKPLTLIGEQSSTTIIDGNGTGTVVTITADNVTIKGFTIQNGGNGIFVWESDNNTIASNTVSKNDKKGIWLLNSSHNNVSGNIVSSNSDGVCLELSNNNTISENTLEYNNNFGMGLNESNYNVVKGNPVKNNGNGISLYDSDCNTIESNNVTLNSGHGIQLSNSSHNNVSGNIVSNNLGNGVYLECSEGNILRNNSIWGNNYNFVIQGESLSHYLQDIDTSNKVDGKQMCYWVNRSGEQVPPSVGYVAIVNSTNITVRDLTLTKNGQGVLLVKSTHITVRNLTLTENGRGVLFVNTTNSTIEHVSASNNHDAIFLKWSNSNIISDNDIKFNTEGIHLEFSETNVIRDTHNITTNDNGVHLNYSSNNTLYHNNFINNTQQVLSTQSNNTWNGDYPVGGNYWSNYTGVDEKSGPNQDQPGKDDFGDTPYVIDENNKDHYPLMKPSPWRVENLRTHIYYLKIQTAIDAAEPKDTIQAHAGLPYLEDVNMNKSLTLLGEDRDRTIIHTENGITITANYVTLSNFTIEGEGVGIGIDILSGSNVTIRNTIVTGFGQGIYLSSSANCTILGNIAKNKLYGIYLVNSYDNVVNSNTIRENRGHGIYLANSNRNTLSGNNITSNKYYGMYLDASHNNTVSGNTITLNEFYGICLVNSYDNVVNSNTIRENSVHGIYLANSNRNTLSGNNITSNKYYGMYLGDSYDNVVKNNTITINHYGMYLSNSYRNTLIGNTINSTSVDGMYLGDSGNNTITENKVANSRLNGINLEFSNDNTIYHNNFINNKRSARNDPPSSKNTWDNDYPSGGNYWSDYKGVDFYHGPYQNLTGGDCLGDTKYEIDANNRDKYPLMNQWRGVPKPPIADFTYSPPVVNQTITFDASSSLPSWNGTHAAQIINYTWDFGDGAKNSTIHLQIIHNYAVVGTYTVTLNITDSRGLCDTTSKNVTTIYPHDVAITNVTCNPVVYQKYNSTIYVTVENQGNFTETFNVTVYANTTEIETQEITLSSGASTTIPFTWNTTRLSKGNYTIWAYAWPVTGEIDFDDNNCTNGWIFITKAGDLGGGIPPEFFKCDGKVDGKDLALFLKCYKGQGPDP